MNTPQSDSADDPVGKNRPKPSDFDEFLPWACLQYKLEVDVITRKSDQTQYVTAATSVHKRMNLKTKLAKPIALAESVSESTYIDSTLLDKAVTGNNIKIMVDTIYNNNQNLVKLNFFNNKPIPREIFQIIALTLPYQKHLTSITINSGLRVESLYEISKLLPDSQITEICLDGTFLSKANYHILLTHGKLKHLSLARCTINDRVVKTITDQLKEPSPAAKVLSALNLSSNKITDIGAKHLAEVLRTNRQLCYLNLAGNMITDKGGVSILDTLQKFPLRSHEVQESRSKYVAYLKKKSDLIKTMMKGLQSVSFDKNSSKKKSFKKGKLDSQSMHYGDLSLIGGDESMSLQERAELLAAKKLGLYNDVFSPKETKLQDDVVYCLGNNTLCCLNLAYNDLTYVSVKKLVEVLTAQKSLNRTPKGLIKVVIEDLPSDCPKPTDFDSFLHWANKQYCPEYNVILTKTVQETYAPAHRGPTKKRGVKPKPIKTVSITTVTDTSEDHEGGVCILDTLQKFQVQPKEVIENRVKYVAFLKKKNALIVKFIKELQAAAADRNLTRKKARKGKLMTSQSVNYSESVFGPEIMQDKAEFMADRQLGEYDSPFAPNNVEVKDGIVYCLGNNTLCCLNLAYNNLSYISLKKLVEVLTVQRNLNRIPKGLIKVVIEGNLMPIACEEFEKIDHLLEADIKKQHKK
ncbi:hypothetical protein PYW08_010625 [Mythimna loreyi]|uniref:Uncharacterized protein n=1 Tax=Mythimna loreyi TaxID=667449 RepID=A0ACC2Q448_9NEOP|nr:hypothetical protein PYW08_010625 [Mythimna loreyi]